VAGGDLSCVQNMPITGSLDRAVRYEANLELARKFESFSSRKVIGRIDKSL
jgi:hypothetical protein